MITARATTKRNVRYGAIVAVQTLLDASKLVTGINNSYGEIDGSNNVVSIKSTSPTGRDFAPNGGTLTFDPVDKAIVYPGGVTLRSTALASIYNFFNNHAGGIASLSWSASIVLKIGNVIKPAAASYGILGNNGASSVNTGACIYYQNNSTHEDALQSFVSRGVGASYPARLYNPGALPSNQYFVLTIVMDGFGSTFRMRYYVNDQAAQALIGLHNTDTLSANATYPLEIGGCGNGSLPLVGRIKEVILTSGAVPFSTVIATVRQLMNKHNIVRTRTSDNLNTSIAQQVFDSSEGSVGLRYHLSGVISQDPVNKNRVFSAYTQGGSHVYAANKRVVGRRSLFKAAPVSNSFEAETIIYNPTDPLAVQDLGGGFDNNGVMHLFTDTMNGSGAGSQVAARHIYSSDLTTWTNTDITASLAADGLLAWRMYGNMIHVGGVWIKPYYKATDQGDATSTAIYVLRSTDGINWTSVTVKAPSATYINEGSIVHLGGNDLLIISRNEVTGEWQQYISADLGLTWTDQGGITFGETVSSANPLMLKSFTLNGQRVIAAYITNRGSDTAFVIYALPADLISSGTAGWNLNTKLMWWKTSLAPFHIHYGDIAHLDDTLKAVAIYTYDRWPGDGPGTESTMFYFSMPTWHVSLIESELSI